MGLSEAREQFSALLQESCRNRHPPDARGAGKRVAKQRSSAKEDRSAAWRAHNAIMQGQRSASDTQQPALPQARNSQSGSRPCSLHADQPAASQPDTSRSSLQFPPAQPSHSPHDAAQLPHGNHSSLRPVATGTYGPGGDSAQSITDSQDAQDGLNGPGNFASAPARKKLSYARLGPGGMSPEQAAASSACGADLDSAGPRRFKIRNRFRASVFRRCA